MHDDPRGMAKAAAASMTMRTIRARVEHGCFEPLEPIDLPEGIEVVLHVEVLLVPGAAPGGTGAAIVEALRCGPGLDPSDVETLREASDGRLDLRGLETGALRGRAPWSKTRSSKP